MRNKLNDWKNDWIAANGKTNELEVVVKDGEAEIYEGSVKDIQSRKETWHIVHRYKYSLQGINFPNL